MVSSRDLENGFDLVDELDSGAEPGSFKVEPGLFKLPDGASGPADGQGHFVRAFRTLA